MAVKNFDFNPEFYDLQVNWDKRLEKEKEFFEDIIKKRKIKRMLDIGCGTGHHAQYFSGLVKEVVAVDPDKGMIEYAKKNVIKADNVTLHVKGFEDLERIPGENFDLITSLGNTISILGNRKKVKLALKKVKGRLSEGGLAVLQFLNYSSTVMGENDYYSPKVFKKDGLTYIFIKHFQYGKKKTRVDFLITCLKGSKVKDFFVNTSYLATLKASMFKSMAVNAGFKKVRFIGTGGREEFDPKRHISLFALLERGGNG